MYHLAVILKYSI